MNQELFRRLMHGRYKEKSFVFSDFLTSCFPLIRSNWRTVYTGTTNGNFSTCAVKTFCGNVLFDKSLEPKHHFDVTYYTTSFGGALAYGTQSVMFGDSSHKPLVLEGRCLESEIDFFYGTLEKKEAFIVNRIWRLKDDVDWNNIDLTSAGNVKHFDSFEPMKYLSLYYKDN